MVRQASGDSGPPKTRRSRNGCNECRRLHRRCDEGKPECENCKDAGKTCSYNRTLSWGGRPFHKSPFKAALESGGVGEISSGPSFPDSARSFVYGQVSPSTSKSRSLSHVELKRTRSVPGSTYVEKKEKPSAWSTPVGTPSPTTWIPWLSEHHRMLFNHFQENTLKIFHDWPAARMELKSILVPMAADTNHGFSLLSAILSLATTHRVNMGMKEDRAEIEYWRDMSIGHLRRPGIQEDGSTENVFAATALMLCIRDAISDGERPLSWRLHLQGASTILRKEDDTLLPSVRETRRLLTKLAISLQLRNLLPSSSTSNLDKMRDDTSLDNCGVPQRLIETMKDIRALRLERLALQAIESNSDSSNMSPLWTSLRARCLETIVELEGLVLLDVSSNGNYPTMHGLYARAAVLQVYSGVMKLGMNDTGLRNAVSEAMSVLRATVDFRSDELSVMLLFPMFTIGSLVRESEDRELVSLFLARIAREHGKANATLAGAVLEELWRRADLNSGLLVQAELDQLTGGAVWDLSLW